MKVTEPEVSQQYTALYQATVEHAVGGAATLMAGLVAHTRAVLRGLEDQATDRRERDRLMDSRRQLNQFEPALCARFSEELLAAFARVSSNERALPAVTPDLHFDQLADMDESQVRQNVQAARVQQALNAELSELNRLICAKLGQPVLQLERYPLRPAVYVDAVTAALTHLSAPPMARLGWITIMKGALGQELDVHYRDLCARLRPRSFWARPPTDMRSSTNVSAFSRQRIVARRRWPISPPSAPPPAAPIRKQLASVYARLAGSSVRH